MINLILIYFITQANCGNMEDFVRTSSDDSVIREYYNIYRKCPEIAFRIPCFLPLKNFHGVRLSSGFGNRLHPIQGVVKHHNGIDISSGQKPVIATAGGRIKRIGFNKGLGSFIVIDHENSYETTYAHLSKIIVFQNNYVSLGDEIGLVGNSGSATGNHIHYEIKKNGRILNPTPHLLLFYYANK
jgi:murein DD-endopeptidase MepM/ murein hydrolase activator NlpD